MSSEKGSFPGGFWEENAFEADEIRKADERQNLYPGGLISQQQCVKGGRGNAQGRLQKIEECLREWSEGCL